MYEGVVWFAISPVLYKKFKTNVLCAKLSECETKVIIHLGVFSSSDSSLCSEILLEISYFEGQFCKDSGFDLAVMQKSQKMLSKMNFLSQVLKKSAIRIQKLKIFRFCIYGIFIYYCLEQNYV